MANYVTFPAGKAGDLMFGQPHVIETGFLADAFAGDFGAALKVVDQGGASHFDVATAVGDFYGVLVKSSFSGMSGKACAVLRKGYVKVACAAGTPVRGAPVYLTGSGAFTADSSGGTLLPGVTFAVDGIADGVAAIQVA